MRKSSEGRTVGLSKFNILSCFFFIVHTDERYDPEPKSKWDEEWDKNKSAFPFSDKLGELSDKIGSTIDDTISKFRRKDREDSPERCRCAAFPATHWRAAGFCSCLVCFCLISRC